jgi:hypothetical protein
VGDALGAGALTPGRGPQLKQPQPLLWLSQKVVQPEGCPNEVWRRESSWF